MNAQQGGKLSAGRNPVARAQITRMDERPQLVAELDVQRNVTLGLEMNRKYCLSPAANSTRYWTDARAKLSLTTESYLRLISGLSN